MKKRLKPVCLLLSLMMALSVLLTPASASAETPYKTYTVDGYGWVSETQAAYTPLRSITKAGDESFDTPMDMMIAADGHIYVADAGKKLILVSDLEGNLIQTIGEGILQSPYGVYVTADGSVYVADKAAEKIVVFDAGGNVIQEYGKPDSPMYGTNQTFKPIKIAVNAGGNMYIICEGNTNGIVQISPADGGSFLGYFGTNYTMLSPFQIIQRIILTDAQRARLLSNIPSTPTNLAIDENGLIYTVTQGDAQLSLKKLNIAGTNMLDPDSYYADLPAALTVGNYENIIVADSDGYIYEYNSEGELLFVFGGRDDGRFRIGLCGKVEATAVDVEDNIYVLDSDKKQIHVFEPTEFTDLIHDSLSLYAKGRYTESKEPLTQVLRMNSLFDYANKAMGRAYLQEENYQEALKYAELSKDFDGYSDAFWEVRNLWLQNNLVPAFFLILAIVILWQVIKQLQKRKGILNPVKERMTGFSNRTLVSQLRYSGYFIKHPIDGCYGVRREGKCSLLCANILIGLFILLTVVNKYFCGFLFKTIREGRYNLVSDIGQVILVFAVMTLCNYLVVTINEGEGSLKQVYCAFAYCLVPYILLKPFVIILSNLITYNETFLVQFANVFIFAWIGILLFLAVKEINNYSVMETIKIILLTLFTVLIMALIVFIVYVLFSQVIDFIVTVFREVVYRFAG